jgi:hypothetical protein
LAALHDVDATHLPIRVQIPPLGRRRALGVSAKKCVGSSFPKESVVYFAIWRPLSIAAVLVFAHVAASIPAQGGDENYGGRTTRAHAAKSHA